MNKKCQQEICVICECDFVRQCKPLTKCAAVYIARLPSVVANGRGDCSLFESRNPFNVTSCNRPDLFTKSSYQTGRVERRKEGKKSCFAFDETKSENNKCNKIKLACESIIKSCSSRCLRLHIIFESRNKERNALAAVSEKN